MLLQRLTANYPDFKKLSEMLLAMLELLNNPTNAKLTTEDLITFQDTDGSFKLVDSYVIESDARCEFCHKPTYIGASILMREVLSGRKDLVDKLDFALTACILRHLMGHGIDAEQGLVDALNIFITGGLHEFMAKETMAPIFRYMIQQHLSHIRNSKTKEKIGTWGEVKRFEYQKIITTFSDIQPMRLYAAYGSNMNMAQMSQRCQNAKVFGKGYAVGYKLTMPFYANIEMSAGKRTPVLLWEITSECEKVLDRYEGVGSNLYFKKDIMVDVEGEHVAAMVYVMTEEYKHCMKQPRCGYIETIIQGYSDAGFDEKEFQVFE